MNKVLATFAVGTMLALAAPGVANAKGGGDGTTVQGKCIASSTASAATSKLSVKADDGRIETEFEVDHSVAGDTWKVTISDNGTVAAHAKRTIPAGSDSFELHKRIANQAGPDMITASAKNLRTGTVCSASATV